MWSFVIEAFIALKAGGSRGGLSGLETLQDGHGIPAPPHPQAFSPLHGRLSCVSQTQKVSRQRVHFIRRFMSAQAW
jgi:hypothetical protein